MEARSKEALSSGLKGLQVRVARKLNAIAGRKGRVFSDRFHARALKTPSEVRHAYAYVLLNSRHHAKAPQRNSFIDPCSSGLHFDGWTRPVSLRPDHVEVDPFVPIAEPRTWLAGEGWRAHTDLISPDEVPGKPG